MSSIKTTDENEPAQERQWKPIRSGVPYTCSECPALLEAQAEIDNLRALVDHFKAKERLFNRKQGQ